MTQENFPVPQEEIDRLKTYKSDDDVFLYVTFILLSESLIKMGLIQENDSVLSRMNKMNLMDIKVIQNLMMFNARNINNMYDYVRRDDQRLLTARVTWARILEQAERASKP